MDRAILFFDNKLVMRTLTLGRQQGKMTKSREMKRLKYDKWKQNK